MFVAGLKFALGLVVGWTLLLSVAALALTGAARFDRWREERRRLQWKAKVHALRHGTPQFRERAVFCFHFRTDDWIPTCDKTEHLQ